MQSHANSFYSKWMINRSIWCESNRQTSIKSNVLHQSDWKNFIGIVADESFLGKSVTNIWTTNKPATNTYWLKCCSAFGSKTTNVMDEPGPILSRKTKDVQVHLSNQPIPATNVFGISGIMSIETGGTPGCKARVTGPKVTSQVSRVPIFCGMYSGKRQCPKVIKLITRSQRWRRNFREIYSLLPSTRCRTMTRAWIRFGMYDGRASLMDRISLSVGMSTTMRCQLWMGASFFPRRRQRVANTRQKKYDVRRIGSDPEETSPIFSPPP